MIETLAQFHFIRPIWLLLVVPAAVIWWAWRQSADPLRGWSEQMDADLLGALVIGAERGGRWKDFAILGCWMLAVIVIAGPTWKPEPNPFAEDASSLIVLLKADASMENTDIAPSRLERARLKIADLAEARKGQPMALIAYAGSAHLVLPPTKDTKVVAQMAAEISPAIMPAPGDHLELALAKAGDLLSRQGISGSVLVIADTVDGDTKAIVEARHAHGVPSVEFLALNVPGSSEDDALRKAANALNARVESLTPDGTDIAALVRAAAHTPVSRTAGAQQQVQWQESGWYLLPILALAAAYAFRRDGNQRREGATA